MPGCSNNCSNVNTPTIFKKLTHLCLLLAFLVLSFLGLKDLLSEQTTFLVSRIPKSVTLPAFTLCPHEFNGAFLDKSLLSQNLLKNGKLPFPIDVSILMQSKMDGGYTTFNLFSEEVLKNTFNATFDEIWDFHCKIYPPSTNFNSCTPCITFKNPTIEGDFVMGQVNKLI